MPQRWDSAGAVCNYVMGMFYLCVCVGGGSKNKQISLKFKFGLLKTDGGVGIFQKSLNFKYFDHMGL